MATQTAKSGTRYLRGALILLIVVLAFVASYQIAVAAGSGGAKSPGSIASGALTPAVDGGTDGSTPAGACCGTSGSGETIEGAAALEGDVQRITVDTANGYDPNVIKLIAGVPAEITFKQASGCMAEVISEDLGFSEDLTTGDKTLRLEADALQPGTYAFSCGMQMVFGTIIVE